MNAFNHINFTPVTQITDPLNLAIGLSGDSGTGKTYTARRIARTPDLEALALRQADEIARLRLAVQHANDHADATIEDMKRLRDVLTGVVSAHECIEWRLVDEFEILVDTDKAKLMTQAADRARAALNGGRADG